MKISKELIEKYHQDRCTATERGFVEEWLFSGESEDELLLPVGENKEAHKDEIWNGLTGLFLQTAELEKLASGHSAPAKKVIVKKLMVSGTIWFRSIAATLIIGLLGISYFMIPAGLQPHTVTVDNTSSIDVKYLDSNGYNIAVGPNTEAEINYRTGFIDFSGSLMISPKEDIELIFHGDKDKVSFKMGQTYIILKDKKGRDKIIVVNERNLLDLPPVIQKRVTTEFNI